jgi:RNA polymerase sigma-70 factor, ECF subfamily
VGPDSCAVAEEGAPTLDRPQPGSEPAESAPLDPAESPSSAPASRPPSADRELVLRAVEGDLDAFNGLVVMYQDYLFAMCVRVVRDRELAADAVQEAFIKAYRNLHGFRGEAFKAWVTRIAINAATDILRERKRRPVDHYPEWEDDAWQPPSGEADDPEHEVTRRARGRALAVAMERITPDQRAAILLFDVEGYDYQEIADLMGVELGTIKSRIHRGRLALRELLADQMELFR